ncbi:MAG: DUF1285 domain-containing protein [Candidatus Competibacter sp.]|nr:DUF1285 domain-containing protein [Candidatus Competibacter sp.]MDG4583007.1 DUF1285 domain-containing protein [Candidatus Competibacter sp.]
MRHSTLDPETLASQLSSAPSLPPVEHWNPPLNGEMDLRITRDGVWHHEGTPIQREALVRLFASILRCDADGHHYLVTPVEKWRIQVDDAPFLAVRLDADGIGHGQRLLFTTNLGDRVSTGPTHPLTVEYLGPGGEPSPYIHVRGRLRALLTRAVFLELVELGEERPTTNGNGDYGVWSEGMFFSLGRLDDESG